VKATDLLQGVFRRSEVQVLDKQCAAGFNGFILLFHVIIIIINIIIRLLQQTQKTAVEVGFKNSFFYRFLKTLKSQVKRLNFSLF